MHIEIVYSPLPCQTCLPCVVQSAPAAAHVYKAMSTRSTVRLATVQVAQPASPGAGELVEDVHTAHRASSAPPTSSTGSLRARRRETWAPGGGDDSTPSGFYVPDSSGAEVALSKWRGQVRQMGTMETLLSLPGLSGIDESHSETALRSGLEASTSEGESEQESEDDVCRPTGGIFEWSPDFYDWVMQRTTTRGKLLAITVLLLVDSARFLMFEYAVVDTINTLSVFVAAHSLSLILALTLTFSLEGIWGIRKIFHWHSLWRTLGLSILFVVAQYLLTLAYRTGLSVALVTMLGKLYLPLGAVVSYFAFKRHYGRLEWISMAMLMLSIAAFMLLRDRCHLNNCANFSLSGTEENLAGVSLVLMSVTASAIASIMTERIYKDRSTGLQRARHRRRRGTQGDRYYIYRAQLDFWTSLVWLGLWAGQVWTVPGVEDSALGTVSSALTLNRSSDMHRWFGSWTKRQYILVVVLIGQSWLAGLVVKYFSTVSKAVIQSISTVLVVCLGDALQHGKYHFTERSIPSVLITVIVLLSAMIFQTGRISMKMHRRELATQASMQMVPPPSEVMAEFKLRLKSRLRRPQKETIVQTLVKYSVVTAYILAESLRPVLLGAAQSNRYFVNQTMTVMVGVCGALFACVMVYKDHSLDGLKRAWNLRKIYKFLMCGFLQAVSGTLQSMAYALGTAPAMVVALGKVYTPMIAVLSRWLLKKDFMWLEWFALIILTAASFSFGMLSSLGQDSQGSSIAGMLCVVASATVSCLFSLVMENLLKTETDLFMFQKIRMDVGTVIFSALFLPVVGGIAVLPSNSRKDLAFWTYRSGPAYWQCQKVAVNSPPKPNALRGCDQDTGQFIPNATLIAGNPALESLAASCICGSGVFVGWDYNIWIYVALAVAVFHGWITGVLVLQYGSTYRAVVDGIPMLLIYFLLDPMASRIPLEAFRAAYSAGPQPWPPPDWARDLVCLIVPLSGDIYRHAAEDLQSFNQAVTMAATRSTADGNSEATFTYAFSSSSEAGSDNGERSEGDTATEEDGSTERR